MYLLLLQLFLFWVVRLELLVCLFFYLVCQFFQDKKYFCIWNSTWCLVGFQMLLNERRLCFFEYIFCCVVQSMFFLRGQFRNLSVVFGYFQQGLVDFRLWFSVYSFFDREFRVGCLRMSLQLLTSIFVENERFVVLILNYLKRE